MGKRHLEKQAREALATVLRGAVPSCVVGAHAKKAARWRPASSWVDELRWREPRDFARGLDREDAGVGSFLVALAHDFVDSSCPLLVCFCMRGFVEFIDEIG